MTWTDDLYAPVYESFGVAAELTLAGDSTVYDLIVIDKTRGLPVVLQNVETHDIRPVAVTTMAQLNDLEIEAAQLRNASLVFNSGEWTIVSYWLDPSPLGQDDGQIYFVLTAAA